MEVREEAETYNFCHISGFAPSSGIFFGINVIVNGSAEHAFE
jgi:hypothetical protein